MMRIVFAGTAGFSTPSLTAVASRHAVVAVVTAEDRPTGRGRKNAASPIKALAVELGLPLLQPSRFDEHVLQQIRELEPEILVVAAYGRIFSREFLGLFSRGGVNVHPSLLPRYRGPAPIPAAILAGDPVTGVTVQVMAEKFDSGDILAQESVPLEGRETASFLTQQLSEIGASMLVSVLDRLNCGPVAGVKQTEEAATYCRMIRKDDGLIRWRDTADEIDRAIRAYDIWPRAHTRFNGAFLYLLRAGIYSGPDVKASGAPGEVVGVDGECGILVQCGSGVLFVERLQIQYRKPCEWTAFLNGHPDLRGAILGEPTDASK